MKISFKNIDKKSSLKKGFHKVTVVSVKQILQPDAFKITFENDKGIVEQVIHNTEKSLKFRKQLFEAVEALDSFPDLEVLVGKKLLISVIEQIYKKVPLSVAIWFAPFSYQPKQDNESESVGEIASIFGVSINEIARDMGKDPSRISISDIMECCGY